MIEFLDVWLCTIFIILGLLLILIELFVGVETGFDLVMLGIALILSGAITYSFESYIPCVVCTCTICTAYIVFGRKYIKTKMKVTLKKTNIDSIINKTGSVIKDIDRNNGGIVKIENEEWKAVSDESIKKGENISVVSINGVTLSVKK